jgi:3-oxoacyl-[acyl-carrier-protein] synthase II
MTGLCPSPATASPTPRLAGATITGWSLVVPDGSGLAGDAELPGISLGIDLEAPPAHVVVGRKGLAAKEPATRLALCAVHRALRRPDGAARSVNGVDAGTAVVASSNLGNVDTVVTVAAGVRRGGRREVSPLQAPNTSSNIIAATIAIWFGFGGPNLMVCSGRDSGLDAIALALLLLQAGRADRVCVVGAEPDDPVARAVYRQSARPRRDAGELRASGACVVLERASPDGPGSRPPRLTLGAVPAGPAVPAVGLAKSFAALYGARGVAQVAVAAALVAGATAGAVVAATASDGREVVVAEPPADARSGT